MAKNIITDYGATPGANCTTAFQNAVNDIRNGLVGRIDVPVGNYPIATINMAGVHGGIFQGEGPGSNLIVTGKDAAGNWWDLCGSSDITFSDLFVSDDGATQPKVLFPWLQTTTSGNLDGLTFDRVQARARTDLAIVYAFGCGNVGQNDRGGSLSMRDCRLTQIGNSPNFLWGATTTPYLKNSVLQVTGRNSAGVISTNATVISGQQRAWFVSLDNTHLIDNCAGYAGTASTDHNATLIVENATQFAMRGGTTQSMGDVAMYIWGDCQGIHLDSPSFLSPDGTSGHCNRWIGAGGGLNSFVTITNPFWSDPGQAYIDFLPMMNGNGGGWYWNIRCNDVAGNAAKPFIGNVYGGGGWTPSSVWLKNCWVETYYATQIVSPGAIDAHTVFHGPVSISAPSDSSKKM